MSKDTVKPPNKEMPKHNSNSACAISTAKVWNNLTQRPPSGSVKPPSKEMPMRNITSAWGMSMGKV